MNTAIVAEYNPFHKGHEYHIAETRKITGCENIIAVMSGNFVQRGEPAMTDKMTRTKCALMNGVDMVAELPVEYATSSADIFATRAVQIIKAMGIVHSISFGSEAGNTEIFARLMDILHEEPKAYKHELKRYLEQGMTYPMARQHALSAFLAIPFENLDFLGLPNNILALEYMLALKDSDIMPYTVERKTSQYNSTMLTGEISSSTAIRHNVDKGNMSEAMNSIPENCRSILKSIKKYPELDDYTDIFHYILRTTDVKRLSDIADITEGLENRIVAEAEGYKISRIAERVKTKRYTHAKIQRALLHILLGITKEQQKKTPAYIRVLGVKKDKIHILSELAEKASIPVITNVKENEDMLKREIAATDIYNIPLGKSKGMEYREGMVVI